MADDEEAEKARVEAEARQKKILEKSRARMLKVSGLQAEADTEDEDTKTSSAARMQAMRKRRFKKGSKAKESTEEASEEKTAEESKPHEEEPETKQEEVTKPSEPEPEPVSESKPATIEAAPSTSEESGETKKKYKGIAKVRREKMLAKKKEEQARQEHDANTASSSEAAIARRGKKLKPPIGPIIMYMFTVLLLFLAGFDVGLKHVDDNIVVHKDLAPKMFSISNLNPWGAGSGKTRSLESDNDLYTRGGLGEQDEFGGDGDAFEPGDPEYTPNIDPIFRVDLDAYTRGPGILMQLARGAVKIHRFFLFLLWEIPMQLFALPMQFFRYPPVMCLVAVVIRQIVAKLVLGAKLPEIALEDVRDKKGEVSDVLDMAKNFVSGTVTAMFPNAVSFYEGFKHLRADMYIVLCGVFVGLAYSSQIAGSLSAGGFGEDEYVPEPEDSGGEPASPGEGLSDEL